MVSFGIPWYPILGYPIPWYQHFDFSKHAFLNTPFGVEKYQFLVLGRVGRVLAVSWAVLGKSWGVLGAFWAVLGRLGGRLERVLGA